MHIVSLFKKWLFTVMIKMDEYPKILIHFYDKITRSYSLYSFFFISPRKQKLQEFFFETIRYHEVVAGIWLITSYEFHVGDRLLIDK